MGLKGSQQVPIAAVLGGRVLQVPPSHPHSHCSAGTIRVLSNDGSITAITSPIQTRGFDVGAEQPRAKPPSAGQGWQPPNAQPPSQRVTVRSAFPPSRGNRHDHRSLPMQIGTVSVQAVGVATLPPAPPDWPPAEPPAMPPLVPPDCPPAVSPPALPPAVPPSITPGSPEQPTLDTYTAGTTPRIIKANHRDVCGIRTPKEFLLWQPTARRASARVRPPVTGVHDALHH